MGVPRLRLLAAAASAAMLSGCSTGSADPTTTGASGEPEVDPEVVCVETPDSCTLSEVASEAGLLVGAATSSALIADPEYAETLSTEFNSLTAENEMKWEALQPSRGEFRFEGADAIVGFAQEHGMAVRGHTLIWAQQHLDATPDWVEAVTDPAELRSVVSDHFATVLGHFGGAVDRWDVVNEPLLTVGAGLYENHFHTVLGEGYIDEMFELADELAPEAQLYVNEATVEILPDKAEALYSLVAGMLERGVPIDGVGLQGHFLGDLPAQGVVADLITRFGDLGLEVAITELDVVIQPGSDTSLQARQYDQVVGECLSAGCGEVTVWGVHDPQSWLDDFLGREDTDPLLFDDDFGPKPAYRATKQAIASSAG